MKTTILLVALSASACSTTSGHRSHEFSDGSKAIAEWRQRTVFGFTTDAEEKAPVYIPARRAAAGSAPTEIADRALDRRSEAHAVRTLDALRAGAPPPTLPVGGERDVLDPALVTANNDLAAENRALKATVEAKQAENSRLVTTNDEQLKVLATLGANNRPKVEVSTTVSADARGAGESMASGKSESVTPRGGSSGSRGQPAVPGRKKTGDCDHGGGSSTRPAVQAGTDGNADAQPAVAKEERK